VDPVALTVFGLVTVGLLVAVVVARSRGLPDGVPSDLPPLPGRPRTPDLEGYADAPRADGWVRTERDVEGLADAVQAFAALGTPAHPVELPVTVSRHAQGFSVVGFPDGVPPMVVAGLANWLDGEGFLTPPDSTVRYALYPDKESVLGETLRGTGSDGSRIEVHLNDGSVHPVASARALEEPDPSQATEVQQLTITVDALAPFAVTGTPPGVPTQERGRVDAALWALSSDPSPSLECLYRPDADEMEVSAAELEAEYGGTLRFSTTSFHDQWLLLKPDGSWVEAQLEDGVHQTYPSSAHLAAELLIRASEEAVSDEALVGFARALGLPPEAASVVREGGGGGDYDAWKAEVIDHVASLG